jgi:uncharacterized protein (TIGR01777 family)
MTVLVTGATGLVGSRLAAALSARGDRVIAVTRRRAINRNDNLLGRAMAESGAPGLAGMYVIADLTQPADRSNWLRDVDAVVHLAGAGVFDHRWTSDYKKTIHDSRVASTAVLAAALADHPRRADGSPKTFVSASAIGYYGNSDADCDESAPPGDDFLARVCVDWETAAALARAAGVRVVHPRISVVLDPAGGALPQLVRPFQFFVGGPVASGRQWVSWIHHADLTAVLLHLLDTPSLAGPVNAAAPQAVRNRDLGRMIGLVLRRPCWLPAPRFALRLVLGEVADAIAGGQHGVPRKLADSGFHWQFPALEPALRNLLNR